MSSKLPMIGAQIFPDVRLSTMDVLREVLTEDNTDVLLDRLVPQVKARLPMWLRWIPVRSVLDRLLPEALLQVFEEILV